MRYRDGPAGLVDARGRVVEVYFSGAAQAFVARVAYDGSPGTVVLPLLDVAARLSDARRAPPAPPRGRPGAAALFGRARRCLGARLLKPFDVDGAPTFFAGTITEVWYSAADAEFMAHARPAAPSRGARCLLYTSPSPRDKRQSRMPSSA